MRIAQEEIFGPVVSIIPCDGLEHAIEIANNIEYGLSSAIYTRDVNGAFTAMRDLHAGITYINAPTIGAEVHLPFGGVKATGNGHREGGFGAIDFYTDGSRSTWTTPTTAKSADRYGASRKFGCNTKFFSNAEGRRGHRREVFTLILYFFCCISGDPASA